MDWPAAVEESFTRWLNSPHIVGGETATDHEPFHQFVWSLVEHGITPDYDDLRFAMSERLRHRFSEHKLDAIVYQAAAQVELLFWFLQAHPRGPDAVRKALYG